MELLDFPPEIFRRVIHCLVSATGVVVSWKLRGVCRTFDQEISENVLAIQPKEAFNRLRAQRILKRHDNMKHFLTYHIKHPRDVFPELPAKIQQMLDYVTKDIESKDIPRDRNIILELCDGVARTCPEIYGLLWGYEESTFWEDEYYEKQRQLLDQGMTIHDKLIAAMSVRAYAVVGILLTHAPVPLPSSVFEKPMTAAVSLEDGNMIAIIMAVLGRNKLKRFKRNEVVSYNSIYGLLYPIQKAIDKDCPEILELLLSHLRDYMKLPDKTLFCEWIKYAVRSERNKALTSLLQAAPPSNPIRINSKVFELGCRTGSSAIVSTLLEHGSIQLDSDNTSVSTLATAIRSGHIAVIHTVIEAGADINLAMCTHRIKAKARTTITPLEYAVHLNKYDAVAYLVGSGATVPPIGTWQLSRKMRKVLQNAVTKKGATAE